MLVFVLRLLLTALVIAGAVFLIIHIIGLRKSDRAGYVLVVRDSNTGRVYGKWPLAEDEEFAIEFIHSVSQSPVREYFRIENGMIRSFAVRFFSFGAGMESVLEEGQTLSRDGDTLLLSGLNTSFRELNYIVGTVSDHLLIINDEPVSLRSLGGRNAHIAIFLE
jgi:hypothetical protein